MTKKIIISEKDNIAALMEDNKVSEFFVSKGDVLLGDVYLSRVDNILPSIEAAFVDVGMSDKMGFIHTDDIMGKGSLKEKVKPNQKLIVQVVKEPTGHKGPRVTTALSLPGRFLVLLPDEKGVNSGQFTIQAIDPELTNTATISFTGANAAAYNGLTFEVGGVEFEFVDADPGADTTKINVNNAMVKGEFSNVELAKLVASAIKNNITEPGRVSASGTSIEFIPTATGPDLAIDVTNLNAVMIGVGRNGKDPDSNLGQNAITLSNQFEVNNTEIESGSMVPGVKFNADGTPQYYYVDSMQIEWANGAENMNGKEGQGTPIAINMGNTGTNDGLTSLSGNFTTNYIKQDGATFGSYAGVSIDEQGVVTALYDNGQTRPIAILPLATFSNPNGMSALTGNAWIETDYSGQALLKMPNSNGAGTVESNSLEQSTVDLATEFSNMIITQRAYSAATKIITTADEMLDELTRMT